MYALSCQDLPYIFKADFSFLDSRILANFIDNGTIHADNRIWSPIIIRTIGEADMMSCFINTLLEIFL